jgi:hypothetical protein
VQQKVIDTSSTGTSATEDLFLRGLVVGENVQRERQRALVDEVNGLINR